MNKKILAVASLSALMLTGCGSADPATAPDITPISTSASATPSPSASTPEGKTSDRGYLVKEVGDIAGMTNAAGDQTVTFVVKKVDRHPKCTSIHAAKPENGNLIGLQIDVQTFKELNDPAYPGQGFWASAASWKFVSKEGITFNGDLGTPSAYNCLPKAQMLPGEIGPAQKATGWVILDVPATEGTLILDAGGGGWEWELSDGPNA